jgi:hypothetical protein
MEEHPMNTHPRFCIALALIAAFALPGTILCPSGALGAELRELAYTTGGASYTCIAADGRLYVGAGSTFQVYDTAPAYDGSSLELLGEFRCGSLIREIQVVGNKAYVAAEYDGVYVFNVRDPSRRIGVVAHLEPPEEGAGAQDVAVAGRWLYVANLTELSVYERDGDGFHYVDSSTPPGDSAWVTGVDVRGSLIAVTVQSEDTEINGVHFLRRGNLSGLDKWSPPYGYPEDVRFADTRDDIVYVAGGTDLTYGYFYVLRAEGDHWTSIYQEQYAPSRNALGPAYVLNVRSQGDTVFVVTMTENDRGIEICEGDASVQSKVHVYRLGESDSLEELGTLPGGLYHFDVAPDGELVHIASEWCGVKTLRLVTDGGFSFEELSLTPTGGAARAADAWGHLVALAREGYGTDLYEKVNGTRELMLLGHLGHGSFAKAVRFVRDGDFLLIGTSTDGVFCYRVADIQAEEEPDWVWHDDDGGVRDIEISGSTAYLARNYGARDGEVVAGKIGASGEWVDIGTWDPALADSVWRCLDLAVRDDKIAVASGIQRRWFLPFTGGALYVITMREGEDPQVLCSVKRDGEVCRAVAWSGSRIYAEWNGSGIACYRLRETADGYQLVPTEASFPWGEVPEKVNLDADGKYLYVAAGPQGLYVLDKETLEEVAHYQTSGGSRSGWKLVAGATSVSVSQGLIYLTDYYSQISVLKFSQPRTDAQAADQVGISPVVGRLMARVLPNPFAGEARIELTLPKQTTLRVALYDLAGRRVRLLARGGYDAGIHTFEWDGRNDVGLRVSPGMYFLVVRSGDGHLLRKKVLLVE